MIGLLAQVLGVLEGEADVSVDAIGRTVSELLGVRDDGVPGVRESEDF